MVGVEVRERDGWEIEDSLTELEQLASTAGIEVVGRIYQRLPRPSPRHYLGSGKLKEIVSLKEELGFNVVIFNDELTPLQQRNLEEILQVRVIDRTALILNIFAKSARTKEGQLQVELAQYRYLLPRLVGRWRYLDRLGGGIGTRGPGEPQLEAYKRFIKERIRRLEKEIEEVRQHRALYRRQRQKQGIPIIPLIGYTNAGKSTLFNTLCKSDVLVEDKLFTTLDPTTRRFTLPDKRVVLISDTVGFIHKLPPTVVTAFRATLEELDEASLLIHIVDIAHKNSHEQYQTVEKILKELKLDTKPRILALNKIDLLTEEEKEKKKEEYPEAILISATKGWGLNELIKAIMTKLDYVK